MDTASRNTDDLKLRRALTDARFDSATYRTFNASLVAQLAHANKRLQEVSEKLRGNSMIRRVAAQMGVPQEYVIKVLYECVERRINEERAAKEKA